MNDQRFYSLKELKDAAEQACDDALNANARKELDDPVNWIGLSCRQAKMWLDEGGNRGYSVLIEEASPDAFELQRFITRKLAHAGFEGIEVVTEW